VETGWRNITSQGRTHVASAGLTEWSRNWSSAAWGFSEVLQQRRVLSNAINTSCISWPLNLCQINLGNNGKINVGVSRGVIPSGGNLNNFRTDIGLYRLQKVFSWLL